jgi:2'-5' RNA ligase
MASLNGQGVFVDSFALVCYLPNPLAAFLDQIRHDFAPDCRARAHVTVLPPRPLRPSPDSANIDIEWERLRNDLRVVSPFRVHLGEIEIFEETQAIYVSILDGRDELKRMHDVLNTGGLAFQEPYSYHPHVTVAQELSPEDVYAAAQFARWRWSEFHAARDFTVDQLTFVRGTLENDWVDLAAFDLISHVNR